MSLIVHNLASLACLRVFCCFEEVNSPNLKPPQSIGCYGSKSAGMGRAKAFVWLFVWKCAVCLFCFNLKIRDKAQGHRMGGWNTHLLHASGFVGQNWCVCSVLLDCRETHPFFPHLQRAEAVFKSAWVASNNETQTPQSRP